MYLGIDIGTSAIKVLLTDERLMPVAVASASLSVQRPFDGWSEQHPQDWLAAIDTAMAEIKAGHQAALSGVRAIGLSGQMHGLVALDKSDEIVRPAILWNDGRNGDEAKELDEKVPAFRTIGGTAVMPGFTAPKALWMARHEADLFNQIKMILLPKDYVRFWLSGEFISDMSDSSGTLWLDVARRDYDDSLLAACHLSRDNVPALAEGEAPAGRLRASLAEKWGITGRPVISGAGDNAAAACGLGVTKPGDAFLSLGTSGVVFAVTDRFAPAADSGAHAFCHALANRWHQMGVILSATDSLSWLAEITGQSVADLARQAAGLSDEGANLYFHPYLSGERTPHNDPDARGGFFGLSRSHGSAEMAYAVLQGVGYAMTDAVDVLAQSGHRPAELLATGGGSKNHHWLQMICDMTGVPISLPVDGDFGASLGAARLAALADGQDHDVILQKPDIAHHFTPDADRTAFHDERRQHWQALFHAVQQI